MGRNQRKAVVALALVACSARAQDQTADADAVHWAYSTYFGSGWYQIDGAQNAFVIRYTPKKTLSEAFIDEENNRHVGVELRFPVTVGLNHFPLDDLPGSVNPENLANVSVTPAIYLTWPVNERWTLRPFAALGWGTLLGGDGSAWSYWGGLKSRWVLTSREPEFALVNSVGFVGYSPDTGSSSSFWPITSALEFRQPVSRPTAGSGSWVLHAHLAYTFFQDHLDLVGRNLSNEPISDQWELGVALSRAKSPISIWRFNFDRLGLSYRFSTDGNLQGIGLIFSSLFDQ